LDVAEALVSSLVVEPADVLDDRQLELRAGASDAVVDELGLEAACDALGQRCRTRHRPSRSSGARVMVEHVGERVADGGRR
jgi:hypothetical protein